jgi:GT2 family glycosyltransferase
MNKPSSICNNHNFLVSITIPTYNRPDSLSKCLKNIVELKYTNYEVVVIDASTNEASEEICNKHFGNLRYYRVSNDKRGCVKQRQESYLQAKGDIVVFIDDDSMVYPNWLNEIVSTYNDDKIGAVGGRALRGNNIYWDGKTPIGTVRYDGFLTDGFDGDPGKIIEVDHLIGCNMSVRRDVLDMINGWDPWYDIERGETDLLIRVKKAGYKILYNPNAVVDHIAAPRQGTKRFSFIYKYRMQRNHVYMLVKNYGFFSKKTQLYLIKSIAKDFYLSLGRITKTIIKLVATIIANINGLLSGIKAGWKK